MGEGFLIQRDEQDIGDLLKAVFAQQQSGQPSRYPDKSYEQGIQTALDWLFGNVEDHPYEQE